MKEYLFTFIVGGLITTAVVYFEASGFPLLSRLAALLPIFTWLSYLFLGSTISAQEIASHARFVMMGTLVAWMPYMFTIYYLAPRIGPNKAILCALVVFIVLALTFIAVSNA